MLDLLASAPESQPKITQFEAVKSKMFSASQLELENAPASIARRDDICGLDVPEANRSVSRKKKKKANAALHPVAGKSVT